MAATFSFPPSLYGVSIDINAPFTPQIHSRERSESLESLNSTLLGTWELITYYAPAVSDPEDIFYPLGKDAKGIIMYNPDGYMAASLLRPGQRPYASAEPSSASRDELADSARRFLGYSGPYYLDESGDRPTVRHLMRLVNFPNWLGNVQTRVIDLAGDRLMLALESVVDMAGVMRNPVLVFVKVSKNDVTRSPERTLGQGTATFERS